MKCKLLSAFLVLTLVEVNRRSFVDTAPLNDKLNDEEVTELEDLKHLVSGETGNSDEISYSKSRTSVFVDNDGEKSGFDKIKSEVNKNGKLVAQIKQKMEVTKGKNETPKSLVKTEIEIPSKGIHEIALNENIQPEKFITQPKTLDDKADGAEKTPPGMEYSPLDMAEYIYWTGDEKNVALMIEEFLVKGLLSRQEAINYLQSIKFNLDFMQARDKSLQKVNKRYATMQDSSGTSLNVTSDDVVQKKFLRSELKAPTNPSKEPSEGANVDDSIERPKLYKEYSLESVIYQLAKVMFSQSLNKGSIEAQTVLDKLVTYLQKEVKSGQVSRNLQRKLLDVLFVALTDTLSEQTESMAAKKEDLMNLIDSDIFSPKTADQFFDDESPLGDSRSRLLQKISAETGHTGQSSKFSSSKKLE